MSFFHLILKDQNMITLKRLSLETTFRDMNYLKRALIHIY